MKKHHQAERERSLLHYRVNNSASSFFYVLKDNEEWIQLHNYFVSKASGGRLDRSNLIRIAVPCSSMKCALTLAGCEKMKFESSLVFLQTNRAPSRIPLTIPATNAAQLRPWNKNEVLVMCNFIVMLTPVSFGADINRFTAISLSEMMSTNAELWTAQADWWFKHVSSWLSYFPMKSAGLLKRNCVVSDGDQNRKSTRKRARKKIMTLNVASQELSNLPYGCVHKVEHVLNSNLPFALLRRLSEDKELQHTDSDSFPHFREPWKLWLRRKS